MYLSHLTLQITSPSVRQSLRDCQDMHKSLMRAFDCSREQAALLYRIQRNDHDISVYAQSIARPQWERIESQGYHCVRMQDITPLLDRFTENSVFRFSLLTMPAKKKKNETKNSRRVFLTNMEEREKWLLEQGKKHGFKILEVHETGKEEKLAGTRASGSFTLTGIPFEGILQITDQIAFQKVFQYGIGAEKAYGFGLLMIGRV